MFSYSTLVCLKHKFRCETGLSHHHIFFVDKKIKCKCPSPPFYLYIYLYTFITYNTRIFSLYTVLLPAILHSLVKDLHLGENMPPAELRMSVKQSDWQP